jgi:hypothetical protein
MKSFRLTAASAAACLAVLAVGCGSAKAPGAGATHSPGTSTTPAVSAPATSPAGQVSVPRCHTSQLSPFFTGQNAAMGGQRGMYLILTNHSSTTCYVYGYPGLAFFNDGGSPMATHLTWLKETHARVVLRPGRSAQAMLTWRVSMDTPTPFSPDFVHITPPDEHAYLWTIWPGGPVRNGDIAAWPLHAAPPGPFPAGTGTISDPFNNMCVTMASGGSTVVAWKCIAGNTRQQWTGYSDGTLRASGRCLDVTGPRVGAKVKLTACTGAASQKWAIGQVSANDFGPITNTGTGTVLADPGSSTNGSLLVMGPNRGDLSGAWHVSFHHYPAD